MKKDIERFQKKIDLYNNSIHKNGIGTLNEHSLHSIIKNYIEEDESKHEVKVCGYVADIFNDNGITEIQTRNFSVLNRKLEKYLDEHDVTIVYPCAHIKHIVWIDPETGECVKRNRSPRVGDGRAFLYEASRIRTYLGHPRLKFVVMLIDMDEHKLLNGRGPERKIFASREEMRPLSLFDIIEIHKASDLKKILPPDFPGDSFKFSDFEKVMRMKGRTARFSMNALVEFGAVDIVGKDKNAFIYKLII